MTRSQARRVAIVQRCPHLSLKHPVPAVDCTAQRCPASGECRSDIGALIHTERPVASARRARESWAVGIAGCVTGCEGSGECVTAPALVALGAAVDEALRRAHGGAECVGVGRVGVGFVVEGAGPRISVAAH